MVSWPKPPSHDVFLHHCSPSAVNSEWIGPFFDQKHPPTRQLAWEGKFALPPVRKHTLPPSHANGVCNMGLARAVGGGRVEGSSRWAVSQAKKHSLSHCIWGSGGRARVRRFPSRFFVGLRLSTCSGWARWPGDEFRSHRHVRHWEPGPTSHRSWWRSLCVGSDRASTHQLRQTPNQTQLACVLVSDMLAGGRR